MAEPRVRRARRDDERAAADLLYRSASEMYDRFAGDREHALAALGRGFRRPGTNASAEVVWVAELDGRVAGAMAAFPVHESPARGRGLLLATLGALPPRRWPAALRLYRAGGQAAPRPPERSLYVDALATDPALRRRGAARALLAEAERVARARGLASVALDTSASNGPARALYASAGFREVGYRAPARGLPELVALVKPVA